MKKNKIIIRHDKKCNDIIAIFNPSVLDRRVSQVVRQHLYIDMNKDGRRYNFIDELEKHGYDITTLKFSIELKQKGA